MTPIWGGGAQIFSSKILGTTLMSMAPHRWPTWTQDDPRLFVKDLNQSTPGANGAQNGSPKGTKCIPKGRPNAKFKAYDVQSLPERPNPPSAPGRMVEVFCGSASLAAEFKRQGYKTSAIDCRQNKDTPRVKSIELDLTKPEDQTVLWEIILDPEVEQVHFGIPCGTASRAREVRLKNTSGRGGSVM